MNPIRSNNHSKLSSTLSYWTTGEEGEEERGRKEEGEEEEGKGDGEEKRTEWGWGRE